MWIRLCVVLAGYVFGLFQTGYFLGQRMHRDIRSEGSGNAGATNALRVFGLKAGFLVFFGDLMKAVICCSLIKFGLADYFGDLTPAMVLYGGLGVILGHTYPFYLNFKGGKGIAASGGMILVFDWRIALICFAVFLFLVFTTRLVSLGSLTALTLFFLLEILFVRLRWLALPPACLAEVFVISGITVLMAYYSHRSNLSRLLRGEENRIHLKKK
ncbi:MAG: glycerol-3-phosphate 1-O-acyltransferase PlsY [Lachnospiraceae bacterium]|nr:glycerol-3-phosphate 1-O-acyltransferase PlsY [Lachnospiraceae bacterium]